MISAGLDYYRAVRDATSEALFFQTYGSIFALTADGAAKRDEIERRDLGAEAVHKVLASIDSGGYPEAVARIACLLSRKDQPLPLERLAIRAELRQDYAELLPDVPIETWRRIRGEQELVVRHAPEQAIETLPRLLSRSEDRRRLTRLLDALLADRRFSEIEPSAEQKAMGGRLRELLKLGAVRASNGSARRRKR
jgi:hypothetical protein